METKSSDLLLSTAYFPPVHYISLIENCGDVYIEKYENYIKQTYRNRCNILSANGILPLVIPVKRFRGRKTPVREVKPDYNYNWQKLHRISIESAYRSAPFYEFYIDDIRPFFELKYTFLLDLNMAILETVLSIIKIEANLKLTEKYIKDPSAGVIDKRESIHPKKPFTETDPHFLPVKYNQVFSGKYGFIPNLSILDLIFNSGPDAITIIKESYNLK